MGFPLDSRISIHCFGNQKEEGTKKKTEEEICILLFSKSGFVVFLSMAATAAPITTKAYLSAIEYGKGEVRVTKVIKDAPVEGSSSLQEIKAQVLLQGDFVPSFVNADNSLVVPTDTCKNTIYFLAKDHLNDDLGLLPACSLSLSSCLFLKN